MYCCGGVTCAGCPNETPNVVGVGVRVSVELSRPVVGPPLRWVWATHASLFLFATVVVLLRNLKPGSGSLHACRATFTNDPASARQIWLEGIIINTQHLCGKVVCKSHC